MTYRYFYSTEESDTALRSILDASEYKDDYSRNENTLTDGVIEYKVELDSIGDFLTLQRKIDDAHIRAIASPDRVVQFGNIRPDNYFDSTKYAAGCSCRDTDTLAHMVSWLSTFPINKRIAQRDLDMYGSATLGTVIIVLSALYTKTYNVPVNGSVNDKTLIKVVKDTTTPAITQTNATCNQAMFDYENPYGYTILSIDTPTSGTALEFIEHANDSKISTLSDAYLKNEGVTSASYVIDFGSVLTSKKINIIWKSIYDASWVPNGCNLSIYGSSDGISYGAALYSYSISNTAGSVDYIFAEITSSTFRYLKITCSSSHTSNYMQMQIRELLVT